jgi:PAS domain S-box-containing protein
MIGIKVIEGTRAVSNADMPSARVFIVDDQGVNRRVLARFAQSIGLDIEVSSFPDPLAAIETCTRVIPDLVVTDFKMPPMDGAEFIRRLRRHTATADVPIIVVTAYEDHEIRREALEAGANDFILSPVDPWEFQTRARNLLKLRAQQLQIQRQTVRESEERFRLLVEGVRDYAIVMLDPEGRVTSWNSGAERLLGYTETEILGHPIGMLNIPAPGPANDGQGMLKRAAADGRVRNEGTCVRKDGNRFQADILITAMRDEAGRLSGFSMVTRDITEHREMEAKIRAALAESQLLLRELHHRVRNNLQVISSILHLQSTALSDGDLKQSLDRTRQRVDCLGLIFRNLRQPDQVTSVDFETYLAGLCGSLVPRFQPDRQFRYGLDRGRLALELDLAGPFGLLIGEILMVLVDFCGSAGCGSLILTVAGDDDGGTIAVTIDVDPPRDGQSIDFSRSHGLGRTIVDALAGQLGGRLDVIRTEDRARLALVIPTNLFEQG